MFGRLSIRSIDKTWASWTKSGRGWHWSMNNPNIHALFSLACGSWSFAGSRCIQILHSNESDFGSHSVHLWRSYSKIVLIAHGWNSSTLSLSASSAQQVGRNGQRRLRQLSLLIVTHKLSPVLQYFWLGIGSCDVEYRISNLAWFSSGTHIATLTFLGKYFQQRPTFAYRCTTAMEMNLILLGIAYNEAGKTPGNISHGQRACLGTRQDFCRIPVTYSPMEYFWRRIWYAIPSCFGMTLTWYDNRDQKNRTHSPWAKSLQPKWNQS